MSPPSVRNNLRIPSPPARSGIDALEPARILAIAPHVFKILCVATRPQIRDAIISRVAIDMIDEICRPVSMDIEPGEPMRLVDAAIDANSDIPVTINVAGSGPPSHAAPLLTPIKKPRLGAVAQEFAQALRGQHHCRA